MQITKGAEYALQGLIALARKNLTSPQMISEIANSEDIPQEFLSKIFRTLATAGLLKSHRGAKGGFSFGKSPSEISMLEVIEVIEGKININACVNSTTKCNKNENCKMKNVWTNIQQNIVQNLKNTSIADLISSDS